MFTCRGAEKENSHIRRKHYQVQWHGALQYLFRFYSQHKNASAQDLEGLFHQEAERITNTQLPQQGRMQLAQLLRARELHRYVNKQPSWCQTKRAVLQYVLKRPSPQASWVRVRQLLWEHCQAMFPQVLWSSEAPEGMQVLATKGKALTWSQLLCDASSPLVETLMAVAAFYFDQDAERPPANWMVYFPANRFPQYWWRVLQGGGKPTNSMLTQGAWQPKTPHCRWEWLAMDLHSQCLPSQQQTPQLAVTASSQPAMPQHPLGQPPSSPKMQRAVFLAAQSPAPSPQAQAPTKPVPRQVFCQFTSNTKHHGQLELLPFEGVEFAARVQRLVHQSFGADGVRLYAALLAGCQPNPANQNTRQVHLQGCMQHALPHLAKASPAKQKQAQAKLQRMIKRLGEVMLFEVAPSAPSATTPTHPGHGCCEHTAMLRVDATIQPFVLPAGDDAALTPALTSTPLQLSVQFSPALQHTTWGQLLQVYADIPASIWQTSPTAHPYILGLWVFNKMHHQRMPVDGNNIPSQGPSSLRAWEASARHLLDACGCWMAPSGCYRALEALDKDLHWLVEQGLLHQVKATLNPSKDGLDTVWALHPLPLQAARALGPDPVRATTQTQALGKAAKHNANQGGANVMSA